MFDPSQVDKCLLACGELDVRCLLRHGLLIKTNYQ